MAKEVIRIKREDMRELSPINACKIELIVDDEN